MRRLVEKCLTHLGHFGSASGEGLRRVDHDSFSRSGPDADVIGGITRVIKAAFAEALGECVAFGGVAEICFTVARHHIVEQTNMRGDGCGHIDVRRGGENKFSPGRLLLFEPSDEFGVIRQVCRIHFHPRGDVLLECRTTTKQNEERADRRERILSQQADERFPHHVRADERAVQIHGERDLVWRLDVVLMRHVVRPA